MYRPCWVIHGGRAATARTDSARLTTPGHHLFSAAPHGPTDGFVAGQGSGGGGVDAPPTCFLRSDPVGDRAAWLAVCVGQQ